MPLAIVPDEKEPRRPTCIQRLIEHFSKSKLVQWLVTYLAIAWLTLQLVQTLGEIWPLPMHVQRAVSLALGLLFFPAGVIAWFHGERGRQQPCVLEVVLVAALLALSGAAIWSICIA